MTAAEQLQEWGVGVEARDRAVVFHVGAEAKPLSWLQARHFMFYLARAIQDAKYRATQGRT